MKKKNLFLSALLAGAMFMGNAQVANAQFIQATTNDITAKSAVTGIQNTSNDQIPFGSGYLRVMAWDGSTPGITWDNNGSIGAGWNLPAGSQDPDIVVYSNGSNTRILVTFLLGGRVYCYIHTYNSSNNTISAGAIKLVSTTATTHINPNVDVTETGQAVIVYEYNKAIYAKAVDLTTGSPTPSLTIHEVISDASGMYEYSHPDVGVKNNTSGGGTTVNIIFLSTFTLLTVPETSVQVKSIDYTAVNTTVGPATVTPADIYVADPGVIQYPRIACLHAPNLGLYGNSFIAVVQNNNKIVSMASRDNGNYYWATQINQSNPKLDNAINEKPVVAYSFEHAIAAWTYNDKTNIYFSGDQDVIMKRMNWSGLPYDGEYSVVDKLTGGNQAIPSISGNFSNLSSAQTFYTFADFNDNSVKYKSSNYANSALRTSSPNSTGNSITEGALLAVYPNPVTDRSVIDVTLREGEQVKLLAMYNLAGQKVASFGTDNLQAGKNQVSLNSKETEKLAKGMYVLRLITDRSQHTMKIQK